MLRYYFDTSTKITPRFNKCPFCGCDVSTLQPKFSYRRFTDGDESITLLRVECPNCKASSGWFTNSKNAMHAWNSRA